MTAGRGAGALGTIADLLRSTGPFAPNDSGPLPLARLLLVLCGAGALYGAVMGAGAASAAQAAFSAVKVPLLLGATLALCLPSLFALHVALGLQEDFPATARAILASQATLTLCLASLAPVALFFYVSTSDYHAHKLFHGGVFALASLGAQVTLARHARVLAARRARHRVVLVLWPVLYVFVALQMAYALRPFVGNPRFPTEFLRADWLGNVYVDLYWSFRGVLG